MPTARGSLAILLRWRASSARPDVFDSVEIDDVFGSVELGAGQNGAALLERRSEHAFDPARAARQAAPHGRSQAAGVLGRVDAGRRTCDCAAQAASGQQATGRVRGRASRQDLPSKIQGTQAVTVPLDLSNSAPAMVAISDTRRARGPLAMAPASTWLTWSACPELTVDPFLLDSVPLLQASGIVPEANQAFVAQRHPKAASPSLIWTRKSCTR